MPPAQQQQPIELPVLGDQPAERSDAAANRCRILEAARAILEERGFEELTMDAVAAAAGVGKGTIFRRFGDRAGLTTALLDGDTRAFQDAFLTGQPPLGPGAPPAERLEAFVVELVRFQVRHMDALMAAEGAPGHPAPQILGTLLIHVDALLREIDPELDRGELAGMILSAISPPILYRLLTRAGATPETLERAALTLVRGVTCRPAGS
jgi:AcrR family transcriptional regulator